MSDELRRAAEVMRAVRDRCVWSQQIDHAALVPYLIEESHEVIEAVESGNRAELREELGDLLWQVLFHAEIASRDTEEPFDIDDVAGDLADKMVRRHPHVFADAEASTPEEVLVHWNAAKRAEKRQRTSALDGIPRSMPSLALAQKMLGRAGDAAVTDRPLEITDEAGLGDALLALVERAREHGWDAERALRSRIRRLEADVTAAETSARDLG